MSLSEAKSKIRLLVVEDHAAVRAGIRALLEEAGDIEVVGEAVDGGQAVALVDRYAPDFILLDMELPVLRGDEVMRVVLNAHPGTRVLVLSAYNDSSYIRGMLAQGARGYLLKEEAPFLLLTAIRSIDGQASGGWLSPKTAQMAGIPSSFEQPLSRRELAIAQHLVQGWSRAETAAAMHLSEQQLGDYLRLLMQKFEAPSLEVLVEIARRMLPPGS